MANAPENSSVVGHMAEALKSGGIAIGKSAAEQGQGSHAVAIGTYAVADSSQGTGGIAIGYQASKLGQGNYSINIGYQNPQLSQQPNNSIILNATGGSIDGGVNIN